MGCADKIETLATVTTLANEFVAPIHDRMPLILPREAHQRWLFGEPDDASKLMVPARGRRWRRIGPATG